MKFVDFFFCMINDYQLYEVSKNTENYIEILLFY